MREGEVGSDVVFHTLTLISNSRKCSLYFLYLILYSISIFLLNLLLLCLLYQLLKQGNLYWNRKTAEVGSNNRFSFVQRSNRTMIIGKILCRAVNHCLPFRGHLNTEDNLSVHIRENLSRNQRRKLGDGNEANLKLSSFPSNG